MLWRTSCCWIRVAKKYKLSSPVSVRGAALAGKPGDGKSTAAGAAFPARLKKIETPRQRLFIAYPGEKPVPVKMRHVDQNLGAPPVEIHAARPQCV